MSKSKIEGAFERGLFASRWLAAPFYVGLVAALAMLLVVFVNELLHEIPHVLTMTPDEGILVALSLIDLSLAANLLLIVIFSGYENFVSKIDTGNHEDRPDWMGQVDFAGLKLKLIASIVAISGIALLKAFMSIGKPGTTVDSEGLAWLVGIHLTFVVSGLLLAITDWFSSRAKSSKA
jgi:uncharacterized protein (TIGR00645 family)